MDFSQKILAALVPIICLLITAAGGYLVALIRKATTKLQQDVDNDTATKYMEMAYEAVVQAVTYTAQTFVDALKAEDAFTKDKQIEAFNTAKNKVFEILGDTAVLALREIYGDFDAWLDTKIEQVCREIKIADKDEALTSIAKSAASMCDSAVQLLGIEGEVEILVENEETVEDNTEAVAPEPVEDDTETDPRVAEFLADSYA